MFKLHIRSFSFLLLSILLLKNAFAKIIRLSQYKNNYIYFNKMNLQTQISRSLLKWPPAQWWRAIAAAIL
jgi:hypothetical protein